MNARVLIYILLFGVFFINDAISQEQVISKLELSMEYLIYTPAEYDSNDDEKWPLLVFLHGAGERGDDIEKVKFHGPPKLIKGGQDFPFIIVSPQVPEGSWWKPALVVSLIEKLIFDYKIDRSRIYLTGLSMGGYGTWETAIRYPEIFAAIAPICGGGDTTLIGNIKNIPVWNFHGAKDSVVPLERSEVLVEALKKAGGTVKFTVYPEAYHDSWTETYNNPELYKWFLSNKLDRPFNR